MAVAPVAMRITIPPHSFMTESKFGCVRTPPTSILARNFFE